MYGQAAQAYDTMSKTATSPRELEAMILTKAASKFQYIADNWETEKSNLKAALLYNRKLWTIFVSNATNPDSDLPLALRNNITNLGIFIFKRTHELMIKPEAEKLSILININRELAEGLRT